MCLGLTITFEAIRKICFDVFHYLYNSFCCTGNKDFGM